MTMTMKTIYKFSRICLLGILIGCGEDFLTRPPLNQISQGSFWKTATDATSGVTAIYDALQMDLGYRLGMMVFGDVAGDDLTSFVVNCFPTDDNFTLNPSHPQFLLPCTPSSVAL